MSVFVCLLMESKYVKNLNRFIFLSEIKCNFFLQRQRERNRSAVCAELHACKGESQTSPSSAVRAGRIRKVQLHQLCQQRPATQNEHSCCSQFYHLWQEFHHKSKNTWSVSKMYFILFYFYYYKHLTTLWWNFKATEINLNKS